ncbi:lipid II:glycine glycyltransferase FemX [Chloroflexus sp.]|uniref:lipid II:glycine glycyltransferase FemX n=1 Tax=Chloroflexus sp. TaxID=1904827 RepID=UPI002ACDB8ED|nr:peptidoglycan bridge formation glycyltransferase FemA/FemB family protein [Chloroflexus sp.]
MNRQWQVTEPSPTQWDAFVAAHPQGNLLQASPWGALKARFGWQYRRLVVADRAGTMVAGAQILFRRYYGLAFGYVPRGPLLAGDPAIDDLLLRALRWLGWQMAAVLIRLEPNVLEDAPEASALMAWLSRQRLPMAETIQPRSTIVVDLRPDEEALFAACSKGHRADIRRAERLGVMVRVGSAADLPTFYAIMQATGARADFGIHSAEYYAAAWQLHQPRARLLIAELNGAPVAAHLVFADARYGRYLYSGATADGLRSGANHLLEWHALRWARELGCIGYDLWGIPDALGRAAFAPDESTRTALEQAAQHDPLIGVYRFKKGFGGRVARFVPAFDLLLLPPLYPLARRKLAG